MSGIDLAEFYETFFDEAQELLQNMEETLLSLDLNQPDKESLNAIFRAAHSIKGGAATFGTFDLLMHTTHKFENVLDQLRNGQITLTQEGLDIFLRAKDILADQVAEYRQGRSPDPQCAQELLSEFSRLEQTTAPSPLAQECVVNAVSNATDAAKTVSDERNEKAALHQLHLTFLGVRPADMTLLKNELELMGTLSQIAAKDELVEFSLISDVDAETVQAVCGFVIDDSQMQITLKETGSNVTDPAPQHQTQHAPAQTNEPSSDVANKTPQQPLAEKKSNTAKPSTAKEGGTIRVATERVDVLVNQIGEVVINQSILNQAVNKLNPIEHADLLQGFEHMAGALRSLQESIMALRMVPMDYAFGRYPRVVRDIAAKLNKKIELKTLGGGTELDKGLIEKMIDPLTHLIRNSLDHGIETPQARIEKGKNPTGTITIEAYQEGGRIVIAVKDDGAGLNRDKIINKALERGLPASASMSDNEAFQLIFQPGFSTADQVTDVSGRGVGMDVVRKNIQEVGGQIRIQSELDKGTTIYISLPLTLAIMDGMSIQTGKECFVMPLSHIVECLQPSAEQINPIGQTSKVLRLRGEHLPIIRMADLFGIANAIEELEHSILIVVQVANERYALAVDRLLGQHQVVVKSLETHYERIPGTSGATILGDGSVALILDAAQLHEL